VATLIAAVRQDNKLNNELCEVVWKKLSIHLESRKDSISRLPSFRSFIGIVVSPSFSFYYLVKGCHVKMCASFLNFFSVNAWKKISSTGCHSNTRTLNMADDLMFSAQKITFF
jgi:hypothetical protein